MALPPLPRSALAPLVLLTVLLVVLSYTGRSAPAPAPKLPSGHTGDDRSSPAYTKQVVALGDLHGSLATAKRVLRMAGVIGLADEWTLGTGTLVQSGDIVDRGTDTFALYRFFEELRVDAEAQGGAFTSLLGNHETMNALGDWRYVTKDDIATFGGSAARRAEMSPDGSIGRAWLANYSLTARIPLHSLESSTLETNTAALSVIHAGLPLTTPLSTLLPYPDRLNKLAKSFLYKALLEEAPPCPPGPWPGIPSSMTAEEAALWDGQGVWWWRGNALDDERKACDEARRMAELIGVRRLISGHTPNFEGMVSRCNGTILLIDTGISPAYGGELTALSIKTTLYPHRPDGKHKGDLRKRRSYPPEAGAQQAAFDAPAGDSSAEGSADDVPVEAESEKDEPYWLEVEEVEELRLPRRGEGIPDGGECKARETRWLAGGERIVRGWLR